MKRDEILEVIKELAKSQGYYCRLLELIEGASDDERDKFFGHLETMHFRDRVDLILYLEYS